MRGLESRREDAGDRIGRPPGGDPGCGDGEDGQGGPLRRGLEGVAWKPDGELLAVGDYDGLLEIRAKDGKRIRSIKTEGAEDYLSVDWHPRKDLIVTGSDRIRVFNASSGEPMTIKHREEDRSC